MADITLKLENELRRLVTGPLSDEKPGGVGTVSFLARCPMGTGEVLAKAKSVLKSLDEATLAGWPIKKEMAPNLPGWFLERCAPQKSKEESDRWLASWRQLSQDEKARISDETDWSLDNWLYWFQPENRQWYWWDAVELKDLDHIALAIEVNCWPFPWGALKWLFRAAGASALEAEQ